MLHASFGKHRSTTSSTQSAPSLPGVRSALRRIINDWWERLFTMVFGRVPLGEQAQLYSSHETTRDYVFNTAGQALWGALFPALTVVATQLAGAEEAGMFTLAFTVATLLLFLGNYGVRTFQVSDIDEMDSFAAYQIQRLATVALMLLVGYAYCVAHSYDSTMMLIAGGAFGYRAIDALADVYEGRLQQMDKLYLSGISIALRSAIPLVVFTALLFVTHSLPTASLALAVSELVSFALVTLPLALLETPKSRAWQGIEVSEIFRECFPAFAAMFLFNLIESVPKFAMEGALAYENQVYFSAIYFPAQKVLMMVGFIYKPQLVRLTNIWQDRNKRGRFDLIVLALMGACVLVTLAMLLFAAVVGIPLASFLYATDFERFRTAQYLMLCAGGLSAAIDVLFQILTVLREQATATRIYVGAFAFATAISMVLVRWYGFMGAVYAYCSVMAVLFVALLAQYALIRLRGR